MPQKLSQVGAFHAARRGGRDVTTPVATTPAESVLRVNSSSSGAYIPDLPWDSPPIVTPDPVPEPASEGELDQARYDVRKAICELNNDHTRLAALQQARERARAELHAAAEAVAEAEQELVKARTHSRAHLIEAYVNNEVYDGPSVADCEARLHIETGHLRDAEELDHALRDEIAEIEGNEIKDHDYARSTAAGSLICRSPEFLSLVARVTTAYQTIRDTRLLVNELARLVLLDSKVIVFALNSQPDKGARYGGYPVDEHLISEWTNAVPSC